MADGEGRDLMVSAFFHELSLSSYSLPHNSKGAVQMARKIITTIYCDGCKKKGLGEIPATVELKIDGDEYDLCDEHGSKFKGLLREALRDTEDMALSA
jgi:hypothetical protein